MIESPTPFFWPAKMRLTRPLAVTIGLLTAPLTAQTLPRLDPKGITQGVDTLIVTYGQQTIGRSIMATEVLTEVGRRVVRQGYTFENARGDASHDTLWVDAVTLLPVREVRTNSLGRFVVAYGAKEIVTLHTSPAGETDTSRTRVTGQVYASATLELLARSLPLAGGLEVPVSLHYGAPSGRSVVEATFRVPRADSLRDKDGTVHRVWIVTVGAAGEQTTFWVDQEDRRVLQFDTEEGEAVIHFRRGS